MNTYKLEYIIKLVGVYLRQKWHFMVDSIGTKLGNINGEKCRMNYINVNHLVRLYDVGISKTMNPATIVEGKPKPDFSNNMIAFGV